MLVHEFCDTGGYGDQAVTAAVRLEAGYPNAELHMVYFFSVFARKDGRPIGAANAMQQLDGKQYQRWSRHRTPQNPWVMGGTIFAWRSC